MTTITRALLVVALASLAVHAPAATPIRLMLLDGESGGPWHKWQLTTPVLKKALEETGLFQVDVVTAPAATGEFTAFAPAFGDYRAVVMNYDAPDERWPAGLKTAFEQYVTGGGGLVVVHAADNAFAGWPAFNEMIGIGAWRGRTEKAGPFWYFKDGKLVSDPTAGPGGQPRHARAVCRHRARRLPSDHQGPAGGVDAPGRRAVRAAARPRQEHDRARHGAVAHRQRRHRDTTSRC